MKTITITIDDTLLTEVDCVILELHTTRSAFIREVLAIEKLEQQHAQGYRQHPVGQGEFDLLVDEQQ